ncbi:MAG TPA: HAD family hydrolase [Bryobacteraceae bacterium]|nr:HAD family hydrolase [Bryobacteraceae bacterium]
MNRAVFLDRDGVLNQPIIRNRKPYPPSSVAETIIVPEASTALIRLKQHGFLLIVVTNQPDVGRGTCTREDVEAINTFLSAMLPLDDFFVCYHDDEAGCECRKPRPGLLIEAAAKHNISLETSYLVGDRWRDIDAGATAGCKTILIDYSYNEQSSTFPPDVNVFSLSKAVDWILEQEGISAE